MGEGDRLGQRGASLSEPGTATSGRAALRRSHYRGSLGSLWSPFPTSPTVRHGRPPLPFWVAEDSRKTREGAGCAVRRREPNGSSQGGQIVARLGRVRARAHHVPVTALRQPRAATSSSACRRVTWAPARWPPALTRLLPAPPQPRSSAPKFPLHWPGFTLH